jgi:invasion protein IalB
MTFGRYSHSLFIVASTFAAAQTASFAEDKPVVNAPVDLKLLEQGWRVMCQATDATRNNLQCKAVFEALSESNQRLVAAEILSEGNKRTLLITTPLGTALAKPLEVKIDQTALPSSGYEQCQPAGCLTRFPISDAVLTTLRKGKMLTVAFDVGDRKVTLPISLAGLGLALSKADL